MGTAAVIGIYRWPTANLAVSSLVAVPPFVCFLALLPALLAGLPAVRPVWFAPAFLAWLCGFMLIAEGLQFIKPFPGRARRRFAAARKLHGEELRTGAAPGSAWAVPLRLVSWNVRGGAGLTADGMLQLADLDPDLVFLQECGVGALRAAIARTTHFSDYRVDGGGNCILSRFPVRRLPNGPLPTSRGRLWAVTVAPGVELRCINVHMKRYLLNPGLMKHWNPTGVREAAGKTREPLDKLHSELELHQRSGPVILAGDFNLPPHYPDLRHTTASLQDCFKANGYGWGKTVRADLPVFRVDMIYVPGDAHVLYAGVLVGHGSDHRIVLAEVTVPLARIRVGRGDPAPRPREATFAWERPEAGARNYDYRMAVRYRDALPCA